MYNVIKHEEIKGAKVTYENTQFWNILYKRKKG